jgi:hypothetical protein
MRKFLWVVGVGALVLALAAPAMALDFKFGGDYRVIFVSYENAVTANTISNSFGAVDGAAGGAHQRDTYIRFMPRFETSDDNGNIQTMLRFRIGFTRFGDGGGASGGGGGNTGFILGGTNFSQRVGETSGGALGNRGVNVATSWMYLDFAAPWGIPLRVRAGMQPLYWHKGIVIDDSMSGVRLYGSVKPFTYEAGWYRAIGGPTNTTATPSGAVGIFGTSAAYDNNYDFYQFAVGMEVAKEFNATVDFVYGDNRVGCTPVSNAPVSCAFTTDRVRPVYYGGLAVKGAIGIVSYDFDFVYGFADGGMNGTFGQTQNAAGQLTGQHTVRGWALDAGVHFPIGPVTVSPIVLYGTGDDPGSGGSQAFPGGISPAWTGSGSFELLGNGGAIDRVTVTQSSVTNLWALGLVFEYRPVKAMYTKFAWGYAGFAKKNGNCSFGQAPCYGPSYPGRGDKPLAGKNTLGNELSFRADYELYTGFKVMSTIGWFIPSRGDVAQEYALQLLYYF